MACTLIALYYVVEGYPIVVAVNRDEYRRREGTEPQLIDQFEENGVMVHVKGRIVAPRDAKKEGMDLKKRGTWIGLNAETGLVVGLTNRVLDISGEGYRSRGYLVLDALTEDNADMALQHGMTDVSVNRYNNFNLFCADAESAGGVYYENGSLDSEKLEKGIYILTDGRIGSFKEWRDRQNKKSYDAKTDNMFILLEESKIPTGSLHIDEVIKKLMEICSYHEGYQFESGKSICIHSDPGTLSSTIIAVGEQPKSSIVLHVNGNPCGKKEYGDYSSLAR